MRAADFIGRQAIAAHPHYTDSLPQANPAGMLAAFRYLGVRNLRTEAPDPRHQGQGTLAFLARNGIRYLFITGGDPDASLQRIEQFLQAHPGSVVLIEGINEPNNTPVAYEGRTGLDAAVFFQARLYALAQASSALAGIPIAGMASWPYLGAPSDLMNLHPYPRWARQPRRVLEDAVRQQQAAEDRPKGFAITEGGWHTLVGVVEGQYEGVDEETQAKLVLNFILDGTALGARYVTLYTLYDEYADPAGTNPEWHYGLFRFDGSPKPSAVALRTLNAILEDRGPQAGDFEPGSLSLQVTPDAYKLLVQHSSGEFFLILWNEPELWDVAANRPIDPPDQITTVRLDCEADVTVFDPLSGTAPLQAASGISTVTVALDGSPLVLRLSNLARCGEVRN